VPGTARTWSVLGGAVFILFMTALIIMRMNAGMPGALSPLEVSMFKVMGTPDAARLVGLGSGPFSATPLRTFFTAAPGLLAAAVFGLNLLALLAVRMRAGRCPACAPAPAPGAGPSA